MTPTQQFIEDAIAGGFDTSGQSLHKALLDPFAWQAVGKTRGWFDGANDIWEGEIKTYNSVGEARQTVYCRYELYQWKMHRFIDHLADGKTIDEALESIQ